MPWLQVYRFSSRTTAYLSLALHCWIRDKMTWRHMCIINVSETGFQLITIKTVCLNYQQRFPNTFSAYSKAWLCTSYKGILYLLGGVSNFKPRLLCWLYGMLLQRMRLKHPLEDMQFQNTKSFQSPNYLIVTLRLKYLNHLYLNFLPSQKHPVEGWNG